MGSFAGSSLFFLPSEAVYERGRVKPVAGREASKAGRAVFRALMALRATVGLNILKVTASKRTGAVGV